MGHMEIYIGHLTRQESELYIDLHMEIYRSSYGEMVANIINLFSKKMQY
jgi:hypothetical protein